MRYLNWDVLLFPGNSRVPLQEFDTKCHVMACQNNLSIDEANCDPNPYFVETESLSHTPVLTSFISSLECGNSFRVSIHSWEAPRPSRLLRTFKRQDEAFAYEARVRIDGMVSARRVFGTETVWPTVIDTTGDADTVQPKAVQFPAFHPDILEQTHWEPSEMYGRVQVIVAEGVARKAMDDRAQSTFDRLRDVIVFSFQHAPKQILEMSGIAWPNALLFRQDRVTALSNIASRMATMPDFEAHAHSPRRYPNFNMSAGPMSFKPWSLPADTRIKLSPDIDDPFVGIMPIGARVKNAAARASSNDLSAKDDYYSIRTARSHTGTDMSGVTYEKPNFEKTINGAAIEEILGALSPERKRNLYEALSPVTEIPLDSTDANTAMRHDRANMDDKSREHNTLSSQPLNTDGCGHPEALREGPFTSRTSSVPVLAPPATMNQTQPLTRGLRSSLDPILPAIWNRSLSGFGTNGYEEAANEITELTPGSDPNTSKRKRHSSPGTDGLRDAFRVSTMSMTPSKQVTETRTELVNNSPLCKVTV